MGKIARALNDYPCGPLGHSFGNSGFQVSESFTPGHDEPHFPGTMICEDCGKLEQQGLTCMTCEDVGQQRAYGTDHHTVTDGAGQVRHGPLCSECYLELIRPETNCGYSVTTGSLAAG